MKICLFSKIERNKISSYVEEILEQIEYGRNSGVNGSEMANYNIKLAIWEIFANFICHGTEESCCNVEVTIEESALEIHIRVTSPANEFEWDPLQYQECPSVFESRGRGLFILQQICHHFSYEQNGQVVKMIFRKGDVQC